MSNYIRDLFLFHRNIWRRIFYVIVRIFKGLINKVDLQCLLLKIKIAKVFKIILTENDFIYKYIFFLF
jgi:hypothetical protein